MLRITFNRALLIAAFAASAATIAPAFADADPTMHEVYEAAENGHLDQAQKMITQVLKDHPTSAKAHYVAAEIYARERNYSLAQDEFNSAEKLEPGLPFAKPESVQELRSELSSHNGGPAYIQHRPVQAMSAPNQGSSIPWGLVIVAFAVVAVIVFVMGRIRSAANYRMGYQNRPDGMPGYGGGYGPAPGGGVGSGIVGGLASGLAVGAGVVAGEELAHHFLDGDRDRGGGNVISYDNDNRGSSNSDMGGNDFGVSDNSSWGDSNSGGSDFGGGGGGDDWS